MGFLKNAIISPHQVKKRTIKDYAFFTCSQQISSFFKKRNISSTLGHYAFALPSRRGVCRVYRRSSTEYPQKTKVFYGKYKKEFLSFFLKD